MVSKYVCINKSFFYAYALPRERGTRLALVEIAQFQGQHRKAMAHIERLLQIDETDPVVLLSFALDTPDDGGLCDRVVRAPAHIDNVNRRRKDRPERLMHQIRYDRAMLYEEAGQRGRARSEFERIYAADPGFEDVQDILGL